MSSIPDLERGSTSCTNVELVGSGSEIRHIHNPQKKAASSFIHTTSVLGLRFCFFLLHFRFSIPRWSSSTYHGFSYSGSASVIETFFLLYFLVLAWERL